MNVSLGPVIEAQTDALLRRIQEVEQQIADLREERARRGESDERARMADLQGQVAAAQKKLLAVRAGQRHGPSPLSPLESTRLALYAVAAVLTIGGAFSTWAAWHLGVAPLLVATVAAPAVIGALMLLDGYMAKRLDDLDTNGL